MERLVTTNEACELLGLSLQGVHYRIKKGLMKAIKQDGKVFVYVNEDLTKKQNKDEQTSNIHDYYHKEILKLKDNEIELLKNTIDWLKEKYENEITRLENSQLKINNSFNDQISLLQKAFNEMREVYKNNNQQNLIIQNKVISVKDFFIKLKQFGKNDIEIKQLLIDRIKMKDSRFLYNKDKKEIVIFDSDFTDIL